MVDIRDINASGELTEINLSGTTDDHSVITKADLDAAVAAGVADAMVNAMNYRGVWNGGTFVKNDVLVADGWQAIVTAESTTDSFVPSSNGVVSINGSDTLPLQLDNSGAVIQQQKITFTHDRIVTEVRAYIKDDSPALIHTLIVANTTDPNNVIANQYPITVKQVGWMTVLLTNFLVRAGESYTISLVSENQSGAISFTYNWNYDGATSSYAGDGEWGLNPNGQLFKINYEDADSFNRQVDIDTLLVGSTLRSEDAVSAVNFMEWTITEVRSPSNDNASFVVVSIGGNGTIVEGTRCKVTGSNQGTGTTPYDVSEDYWSSNQPDYATVTGGLFLSGIEQSGQEDNAFGIQVDSVNVSVSNDWKLLSGSFTSLT